MQQQKKESLLSQRGQMFAAGFGFWLFLMFWSISAFWQHVDSIKPTYLWPARIGACAAEFAILVMVFLKCFNKHIGVRKWALILGTSLAVIVAAHTAGLRGLDEAQTKQADTEQRLRDDLTKMSKEQAGAIKSVDTGTQKERLAKNNQAVKKQAEVAANAQELLAKEYAGRTEKLKESSIFPRWYLDGWMYGVLFALSAIALAIPLGMMGNRLDIDSNFDGVPDHLQRPTPILPLEGGWDETPRYVNGVPTPPKN